MGRYSKAILFIVLLAGVIIGLMYWWSDFQMRPDSDPSPSSESLERAEQRYHDLASACRETIDVWGDFRGTVPGDALVSLKELKALETSLGRHSDRYDESSELADILISKMKTAKEKWEIAGDDQKTVNTDRAQDCYQLSLELAEAIESVRREVLGMEDGGMSEEIRRIRNKIDRLN